MESDTTFKSFKPFNRFATFKTSTYQANSRSRFKSSRAD